MKGEQGIYEIRNKVTGEVYIGNSKNTKGRMHGHKASLRKNEHYNKPLQRAWNKYGEKAFSFRHIETVYSEAFLLTRERDWINELEEAGITLYNIGIPANNDRQPKVTGILFNGPHTLPGWTVTEVEPSIIVCSWQETLSELKQIGDLEGIQEHIDGVRALGYDLISHHWIPKLRKSGVIRIKKEEKCTTKA